jgi:hypothetical protein
VGIGAGGCFGAATAPVTLANAAVETPATRNPRMVRMPPAPRLALNQQYGIVTGPSMVKKPHPTELRRLARLFGLGERLITENGPFRSEILLR